MVSDPVVAGYLGRALSFELSAVQQYLSLAKLLELRGMPQAAVKFREDATEEMEHVERLIGRMLGLGLAPNASCLRAAKLEGTLGQLMVQMVEMESEIVEFYTQAVHYCSRKQDHESRMFFEALLREEQQHIGSIGRWWQEIEAGQQTDSK